jgi:hypothetical protein
MGNLNRLGAGGRYDTYPLGRIEERMERSGAHLNIPIPPPSRPAPPPR